MTSRISVLRAIDAVSENDRICGGKTGLGITFDTLTGTTSCFVERFGWIGSRWSNNVRDRFVQRRRRNVPGIPSSEPIVAINRLDPTLSV